MTTDLLTPTLAGSTAVEPPVPTRSLDLDPVDRMLLTADGTVTTLLEACAGEPIITETTRQAGPSTLDRLVEVCGRWWHPDALLLTLEPAERMVARRVTLRGARSGVPYVFAESLVAPDRLPGITVDCFRRAGASLGRLFATHQLETRREVLDIVQVRAEEAGDHLGVGPNATLARRTYTIEVGGQAVAAVTEWLVPGRLAARTMERRTTRRPMHQRPHKDDRFARARLGLEFTADL